MSLKRFMLRRNKLKTFNKMSLKRLMKRIRKKEAN